MLAYIHLFWMSESYRKTMKGLYIPNGLMNDHVIYSLEMISQR